MIDQQLKGPLPQRLLWPPTRPKFKAIYIKGVEITQGVQFYRSHEHLNTDVQSDNSVRVVSGKPAWVRVYVTPGYLSVVGDPVTIPDITGTLQVHRRQLGMYYVPVANIAPEPPGTVTAHQGIDYVVERAGLWNSLNFVVPADVMCGNLLFEIELSSPKGHTAERIEVVDATLRQTLRVAGVMISYDGPAGMAPNAPNLTIAAPTLPDLQAMAGTTLTLFPVQSSGQFRTAGTIQLTHHLQDTSFPQQGCGDGWNALHADVVDARTADGNQPGWVYYGLLPNGVPMGPVGGCGGGGVAVGPVNRPATLAHEIGHACGLKHAPAGGAPNPDANYPAYDPYPAGSIGEYGLDVNNGNIASPQNFFDFMSYAAPRWISPYHYSQLINIARLNPTTVCMDYPWWKDLVWDEYQQWLPIPQPDPPPLSLELPVFPPSYANHVISLIVKIEEGRVADVLHVARTVVHSNIEGTETPFTAVLRDAEGAVLARSALYRLDTTASGCPGNCDEHTTYIAQAFVADVAPGAVLEIASADEVLWQRRAPTAPPVVERARADADRNGNVSLSWDASDGVTEYWLRWSRNGESWRAVATGVDRRELRLERGALPPGQGLLQIVAHDGFFSTYSDALPVSVPDRPPDVVILHPVDGHTYMDGQKLRLWASVAGDAPPEDDDAVWLVDGKEVARGLDAWTVLDAGEHEVSFRLGEPDRAAQARVTIQVRGGGR